MKRGEVSLNGSKRAQDTAPDTARRSRCPRSFEIAHGASRQTPLTVEEAINTGSAMVVTMCGRDREGGGHSGAERGFFLRRGRLHWNEIIPGDRSSLSGNVTSFHVPLVKISHSPA